MKVLEYLEIYKPVKYQNETNYTFKVIITEDSV